MLVDEKRALSLEELEAQTALELPDREMMQIVIVIGDVLSDNEIEIEVEKNRIAVQVCALIEVLNLIVAPNQAGPLTCEINQPGG
jgi:hypothetical protein